MRGSYSSPVYDRPFSRLKICDTAQRGQAATKVGFGPGSAGVSPACLGFISGNTPARRQRSQVTIQAATFRSKINRREMQRFLVILIECNSALLSREGRVNRQHRRWRWDGSLGEGGQH